MLFFHRRAFTQRLHLFTPHPPQQQQANPSQLSALGTGLFSCTLLLASHRLVLDAILRLPPTVLRPATRYLRLRAVLLVLQLVNTANNGVLQGYRRVGVSAGLVTVQEAIEIAGSVAVLRYQMRGWSGLQGLGCVQLLSAGVVAVVGLVCVAVMRPVGMPGHVAGQGRPPSSGPACADAAAPLLDGEDSTGEGAGVVQGVGTDHWWDFVVDGGNMLIRSMCLQVRFV